ncbi:MAG: AAA family ATPase [Thermodesulfobacteriota bacterium]
MTTRRSTRSPKREAAQPRLTLGLLGEIALWRGEERLELPPSKKTRALLAYLAVTGRPHGRERLCSLLWDVADDPRAALRWSLSKLRALVDEPGQTRLVAERDSVALVADGMQVDLLDVRHALVGGVAALSTDRLRELAARFRGELLEGLELTDFFDFYAWCVAERSEARALHGRILAALLERLAATPLDALPYAQALVRVDPLDEGARAGLVRLLGGLGRHAEAAQQHEAGMRLFEELRASPSGELARAWEEVRRARGTAPRAAERERETADEARRPQGAPAQRADVPAPQHPSGPPLVGRAAESTRLNALLDDAARGTVRCLLLAGDPGVGKTRLLRELLDEAGRRGATSLEGRAFEAERSRAYGPWIDALQQLPHFALQGAGAAELAALVRGSAPGDVEGRTREHLFGAVAELIASRGAPGSPVLLVLDDVQWFDDASAALLHWVARANRGRPLGIALAARRGELPDNAAMARVLRSLRQEELLEELAVGPLDDEATRALVAAVSPGTDVERVRARSAGNPLLVLELTRAPLSADGELPATLRDLVRGRIERLPPDAADVLRWGAVLGRTFNVRTLRELASLDLDALVLALDRLERHALIGALADPSEPLGAYAFTHEVVQSVVYADMSEPRRRLMHLRIAQALEPRAAIDESVTADVAHHAALAGDAALAARACVSAGRRSLRLFANATAESLVRRGMRHAEQLRDPERVQLSLELWEIALAARKPEATEDVACAVERLANVALDHGCFQHARLGFHLLSYLRWEGGAWSDAQRHMMRAELVSRSTDPRERAVATAEAARCLAMLERDLGHADALLLEAQALAERSDVDPPAIPDALGMLQLHRGRIDEAVELFARARAAALRDGDRRAEFQALEHLAMAELQRERWDVARGLAAQLADIAGRLREGSEAPFARALLALSRHGAGETDAEAALEQALEELRLVDAKHRLVFALTRLAELDLARGATAHARRRAAEALGIARILERPSEIVLALAVLQRAAAAAGERDEAGRLARELGEIDPSVASSAARERIAALRATAGERVRER